MLIFLSNDKALNLPSGLLESICYIESRHNTTVIAHRDGGSDSYGICQIKLATARHLGFKGAQKQLMEPEVNIHYAGKLLVHLIARYKGDIVKAVVAYNMGSAKTFTRSKYSDKVIKQWRKRNEQSY